MKKLLLSFAILAAVASCAKNEVIELPQSSEEISFTSLNDRIVSRTASETTTTYNVYAAASSEPTDWYFSALAVSTTAIASNPYIEKADEDDADAIVGYTKYSTDDSYTGTLWWPSYALTFYAYATGESVTPTAAINNYTPSITIPYVVSADADDDFTVATPVSGTTGTVQFTFKHMLAKITVELELDSSVTASNLNIDDVNGVFALAEGWKASLTVASNRQTAAVTTGSWTGAASSSDDDNSALSYDASSSIMILPQAMIGSTLSFSDVTITYDSDSTSESASEVSTVLDGQALSTYTFTGNEITNGTGTEVVTTDAFQAGYHYVISVTIGLTSTYEPGVGPVPIFNIISFQSRLADWTDATIAIDSPSVSTN